MGVRAVYRATTALSPSDSGPRREGTACSNVQRGLERARIPRKSDWDLLAWHPSICQLDLCNASSLMRAAPFGPHAESYNEGAVRHSVGGKMAVSFKSG